MLKHGTAGLFSLQRDLTGGAMVSHNVVEATKTLCGCSPLPECCPEAAPVFLGCCNRSWQHHVGSLHRPNVLEELAPQWMGVISIAPNFAEVF